MAHSVIVGNQAFKRRSPLGVWLGLPLITFGIYHLVWYYKINDEARRLLNDPSISPGISLLAIWFGGILIVPPFISVYNTTGRIQRMQRAAGLTEAELAVPWLAVVLVFVFGLHSFYLQSQLNKIWDRQQAMRPYPAMAA